MSLNEKQIYDLNNMNVAAQNAKLGDLLSEGVSGEAGQATVSEFGTVKKMTSQEHSVATGSDVDTLKNDFNSLLDKLKSAGMME